MIVTVTSLRGVGLSVTKKSNICQVPPLHRHLIPGRPEAEVKFAAGDASADNIEKLKKLKKVKSVVAFV